MPVANVHQTKRIQQNNKNRYRNSAHKTHFYTIVRHHICLYGFRPTIHSIQIA